MALVAGTGAHGVIFDQALSPAQQRDLERHVGAQAVVIVRVGRVFPNCGRYVHRDGEISKFAPRPDHIAPIPDWKRIEALRDMLPSSDQQALAEIDDTDDGSDGSKT